MKVKNVCRYLGNSISIGRGRLSPCCEFNGYVKQLNNNKTLNEQIVEYWNNDRLELIREFKSGKYPDGCIECQKNEELSDDSYRIRGFKWFKNDSTDYPTSCDIRMSNMCNLKCRMCGTYASSMIQKEIDENKPLVEHYGRTWSVSADVIDYDLDFSKLTKLKILGGEPTIDPYVKGILKTMDHKENINFRFTKNGTNAGNELLELLEDFKSVAVNISLDGDKLTSEYIRTNSNWEKIIENITVFDSHNKINRIGIMTVIQMYNILTIDKWLPVLYELEDGIEKLNTVEISLCQDPQSFDIKYLPKKFKDIVLEKSQNIEFRKPRDSDYVRYLEKWYDTEDDVIFEYFKKITNTFDQIRNTDIRTLDILYNDLMEYNT